MSSCLSGGGRAYGFELEIVTKSPSPSTQTLHSSSSPSSTLSESSNSPLAISTRKARTPRKRPNQIYNEAARILSTAYPNIFSIRHLTKNPPCKFTKPQQDSFFDDSPELLLPFPVIDDLGIIPIHQQPIREKSRFQFEPKVSNFIEKSCLEIDSRENSSHLQDGFEEDFDAESILDEEIEEGGIDSIMGNLSVNNDSRSESNDGNVNSCFGYPMGLGFGGKFDFGFGMKLGVRAFKPVDEGDWWRFPAVDVREISPKFNNKFVSTEKKKKKKKMEKLSELKSSPAELPEENSVPSNYNLDLHEEKSIPKPNSGGLLLKLNYDGVLNSWSGRGSPFSDDVQGSDLAGADAHARLAQIDLFPESGGVREASVLRYKEKRRTRLFSKKIRYQVRKVNADRRPRMKGRFVRRPNSSSNNAQR